MIKGFEEAIRCYTMPLFRTAGSIDECRNCHFKRFCKGLDELIERERKLIKDETGKEVGA